MVDLSSRPPPTAFSEHSGLLGVRVMESINICLFRLSKGRVGGTIFGAPVILLTTSGRKTGTRHTKPLLALEDGESWIIVGSRGGTSHHPDWYLNLMAHTGDPGQFRAPEVEAAGDVNVAVHAVDLRGDERDLWWQRLVAIYPKFDAYQQRAPDRQIPVIRLTPTH